MTQSKVLPAFGKSIVRSLSLFNLFLTLALFLFLFKQALIYGFLYSTIISSSIILMLSDTYKDHETTVCFSAITFSISLLTVIASCVLGSKGLLSVMSSLTSTVPLSACLTTRCYKIMKDPDFLTMRTTGWQLLLLLIRGCYIAFFLFVSLFTYAVVFTFDQNDKWTLAIPSVLITVLYIILIVRSITATPIIYYNKEGKPQGDRDIESRNFITDRTADYKAMFNRMSRLMEDTKPFLDAGYSIDHLVKAMGSNRAYVSRLISMCTGLNFSQYINRYRVNYAREMFQIKPELKVKELSDMSGFNSQVTFNMAFKMFYQTTPGTWCKLYRSNLDLE